MASWKMKLAARTAREWRAVARAKSCTFFKSTGGQISTRFDRVRRDKTHGHAFDDGTRRRICKRAQKRRLKNARSPTTEAAPIASTESFKTADSAIFLPP